MTPADDFIPGTGESETEAGDFVTKADESGSESDDSDTKAHEGKTKPSKNVLESGFRILRIGGWLLVPGLWRRG